MNLRARLLCCLIPLAMLNCGATFAAPPAPAGQTAGAPRILVMVRMPPPHFHPANEYGGGYDSSANRAAPRRIAHAIAGDHRLQLITDWPMPALGVDCFVMTLPGNAEVTETVDALRNDPRVESAQPVQMFHALGAGDPLYALQPDARFWRLNALHRTATGRGVKVALIDTGVQTDHPDLRGQFDAAENFVDDARPPAEIHGTAIAGIIGAHANNGIGIAGVAPQARLLALRACWQRAADSSALCDSFTLAKALQFALEQHVAIINLSLSGPRDELLGRLLDVALQRDIAVVGAVDPAVPDGGYPAAHPGVFAVGGYAPDAASRTRIEAPALDLPATLPGNRWGFVSGTSFAAAEVSGVLALLHQQQPRLSLAGLRATLASVTAGERIAKDACAGMPHAGGNCQCGCGTERFIRLSEDRSSLSAH